MVGTTVLGGVNILGTGLVTLGMVVIVAEQHQSRCTFATGLVKTGCC